MDAWQLDNGDIVFAERGKVKRALTLSCGQCVGCRLERSRQWATRCVHESKMHKKNCFITLTYNDEHVGYSLRYSDFQKFCKRMRKAMGPFRFYMCGEYGEKYLRPHFHACIFGLDFGDKVVHSRSDIYTTYTSKKLSDLWPFGFSLIGDMNFETAAYVARYCMKKVTGHNADAHYTRVIEETGEEIKVTPEFNKMSLRPGIGADFYRNFKNDVFPRDYIIINGVKATVPRYYKNLLKIDDPELSEYIDFKRYDQITEEQIRDRYAHRLEVREKVVNARLSFNKRDLE